MSVPRCGELSRSWLQLWFSHPALFATAYCSNISTLSEVSLESCISWVLWVFCPVSPLYSKTPLVSVGAGKDLKEPALLVCFLPGFLNPGRISQVRSYGETSIPQQHKGHKICPLLISFCHVLELSLFCKWNAWIPGRFIWFYFFFFSNSQASMGVANIPHLRKYP